MSEIDDGGPMFAVKKDLGLYLGITEPDMFAGLTKREWYAGMALQGHLSNPETTKHPAFDRISLSVECYAMADSMIRAGKGEK